MLQPPEMGLQDEVERSKTVPLQQSPQSKSHNSGSGLVEPRSSSTRSESTASVLEQQELQQPVVMVLSDDPRVHRQRSALRAAGFLTILVTSLDAAKSSSSSSPESKAEMRRGVAAVTLIQRDRQRPALPTSSTKLADVVLSWNSLRLGEYRLP